MTAILPECFRLCQALGVNLRNGDLSSRMLPRLLVVFEGAIGILPVDKQVAFDKAVKRHRWQEAIGLYELNELILSKILDLHWRLDVNVTVVTWMGEDAELAISMRLDEENIPAGTMSSSPNRLARELSYRPDIVAVYDPDPAHVFTYGGKGVVLTDANQLGRY